MLEANNKNAAGAQRFEESWAQWSQRLIAFARHKNLSEADAQDLAQETLSKVFEHHQELHDSEKLEAWVFQIARRTIVDRYRRTKTSIRHQKTLVEESEKEDEVSRRELILSWLPLMITLLDEPYYETMRLHVVENMSQQKVAEFLELPLSTVKSRIQRGRKQLRAILESCCQFELDSKNRVYDFERKEGCEC